MPGHHYYRLNAEISIHADRLIFVYVRFSHKSPSIDPTENHLLNLPATSVSCAVRIVRFFYLLLFRLYLNTISLGQWYAPLFVPRAQFFFLFLSTCFVRHERFQVKQSRIQTLNMTFIERYLPIINCIYLYIYTIFNSIKQLQKKKNVFFYLFLNADMC